MWDRRYGVVSSVECLCGTDMLRGPQVGYPELHWVWACPECLSWVSITDDGRVLKQNWLYHPPLPPRPRRRRTQ